MKFSQHLTLIAILILLAPFAYTQPICGFDALHKDRMQNDPAYRANILSGEAAIRTYIQQHPGLAEGSSRRPVIESVPGQPTTLSGPPYTIPVVVHVIHTGGAVGSIYNPTDAQIKGAIDYLNAVYNGTYSGLSGGVGDLQIQFALAKRDPNCNPTNGINRVNGSGVTNYVSGGVKSSSSSATGTAEINIKNLSRWDPTQYYNVWVVDKIDGNDGTSGQFIAGFAYFPGASSSLDGIIMLATQMVSGQKTLPHEIGHAFNLYHPFEGSANVSTCPANSNCSTDGDQVCDTDPISENISGGTIDFSCRTGLNNTCTGTVYTVNTEANFMNYTNCYTLFTAGQKARMLAAAAGTYRTSLTTSLGATAPDAGSTVCTPKIDFELTDDQQTETTTASSSCRAYTDYNYNMVIGVGPSAAASVTLTIGSGTAVRGMDYDITTNGSFTSPSMALNFPAGSTTAQPFTIRVYDDASVNGTRTVTLGFTVSNGGGNAIAGDSRTSFTMTINDNDHLPQGPSTPTASIGGSQTTLQSPFVGASAKEKTQILYYASELLAAGIKPGIISSLALNISKASATGFVYTGMTIKVAQTTQAALYNGSGLYPLLDGAFTTIYSSNYSTTSGWNTYTLSSPFTWDGTSNLAFQFCYDNGSTTGSTDGLIGYYDGSGVANYIFGAVNCGTAISSFSYYTGAKPQIRLVYADPGDSVQTVTASRSQYLGPNADVYFYSQTDGKLLARIQNLSSWDYGCTQVLVDRTGTGATAFWNNATPNYLMNKTIKVIPTNNNTSGSYNITLYYTPTEISGWQTATSQSAGSIQLIKVASQVSDVTPANPTGGGAVVIGTPTIGSLSVNTTLTYNFTTGFSGFGAGIPGAAALPLGLLDFTGQLSQQHVNLAWNTSYESGTSRFGIERSYDGTHFTNIGYVDAAGNSSSKRSYTYIDPAAPQQANYYRLQQIDLDGKYTYSKTLLISSSASQAFTVYPSPFTNGLDISFSGTQTTGRLQLRLQNITGQQLFRSDAAAPAAGGRIHLDLSSLTLSPGVYILEINGQPFKIMKQ